MRPSKAETFLRIAELLAERSTCERAHVGALVTDGEGLRVLGIGYNGNARGLPNRCDDVEAMGNCGCIHAETNALLKADGTIPGKVLYTTTMPCVRCAKAIINSGIVRVVARRTYRDDAGGSLLLSAGVDVEVLGPSLRQSWSPFDSSLGR